MNRIDTNDVASVKLPTPEINDGAKVRIGGQIPSFPPVCAPARIVDTGQVRMGSTSFPPVRVTRAN
jgi:hypothetical protein